MNILIEVFSVFVMHLEDISQFYYVNRSFRKLLSSPFILNLLDFETIDDLLDYCHLGLSAHRKLNLEVKLCPLDYKKKDYDTAGQSL